MTEYEVLAEAKIGNPFPFVLIAFCIIEMILMRIIIGKWTKDKKSISVVLMSFMVIIAFIAGFYFCAYREIRLKVTNKYERGEYSVIEGIITDYEAVDKDSVAGFDTFKVNGIEFRTNSFTGYGYKENQCDGGVLDNGLKVRITYIPYTYENVIMKLEVAITLIEQ